MKKMLLIFSGICGLGILCAFAGWNSFVTKTDSPDVRKSRTVKLFRVQSGENAGTIVYPGRLTAREHAKLFFRVSGPVVKNELMLGMNVKKGDVLMQIDSRDYEREVAKLAHELEVMKAKHVYLQKEYERMEILIRSSATSRTLFEAATSVRDASAAEIKGKETALQIAGDRLDDTRLTAPFNGRIIRIGIEKFEMAKANEVVLELQNLETLDVIVNIPEGNIPEFTRLGQGSLIGKTFPVFFPGRNRRMPAKLAEFSPAAGEENGMYELRMVMKQPDDFMALPGMTVEVHGIPGRFSNAASACKIPYSSIFRQKDKNFVWVFNPKTFTARRMAITPGTVNGKFMETDSLPEGTLIVAAGGTWIDEDTKLSVINGEVLHEYR